jgi:7,8-dihydropterin-6-yl-methyl-4-(beta-D-ribofuranosyl)aminobenzene 5'-phosphate synthase
MKISILVDNNTFTGQFFVGEPAVSYFIETDDKKILFDVGYSDAFLANAQKMKVEIWNMNYVILSHGHLDHTWGMPFLMKLLEEKSNLRTNKKKPVLITHPATFTRRRLKKTKEIGPNTTTDSLIEQFDVRLSAAPVFITEKLAYLGEIPRVTAFEAKKPLGNVVTDQGESPDFLMDDSALAYRSNEGLVIITGCSHSGICNIVEYAKHIMNEKRILDIIGGLHLSKPSKTQLSGTSDYISELKPLKMHACHCTDLQSKIALADVANLIEVGSGMVLDYP